MKPTHELPPSCGASCRRMTTGRALFAATALAMLLLLPSCFTAALWGMELREERDPYTGESETVMVDNPDDDESFFDNFFAKLLLTPLTVVLDCVTCPVQAWIYGFGDFDEEGASSRRRDDGSIRAR